jgi:hypothetical protein
MEWRPPGIRYARRPQRSHVPGPAAPHPNRAVSARSPFRAEEPAHPGPGHRTDTDPYGNQYGHFVRWQGDIPGGSSTANPLTLTMDANKTITAVFESDPALRITIAEPGWGTVAVNPILPYYADGTVVTLAAEPNAYHKFVRWQGDVPGGSTTQNPLTIAMDADKAITAQFEWPMYLLTTGKLNDGKATIYVDPISPNFAYHAGTLVTLTAVPSSPSKTFLHWEIEDPNHPGDGNYVIIDANNPITVLMDTAHHMTALFHCGSGMEMVLPLALCVLGLWVWMRQRA